MNIAGRSNKIRLEKWPLDLATRLPVTLTSSLGAEIQLAGTEKRM